MISILGIMSGSSMDGIDLAICEFPKEGSYILHKSETIPLPDQLSDRITGFASLNPFEIADLDADFSLFVAQTINNFIGDFAGKIGLIVSHGHTIYHNPPKNVSWQLGNGGIIASKCGIDTLCDLRIQDVTLGGEGAPLASTLDFHIFKNHDLLINLGGIANVSLRGLENKLLSWDVGPCNQILNALAARNGMKYDDEGKLARKGIAIDEIMESWQKLDYFNREVPKSLDNSWVRQNFIEPILMLPYPNGDLLATSVEFLARQLADDIRKNSGFNMEGLVTGGGAHNTYLIERINAHCSDLGVKVQPAARELIDYKEAILMAFMGHLYQQKRANTVSSATGAVKDIQAGGLYLGNG